MQQEIIMKQEVGQQQKVAKVTKVRRSRQPRNAQLSVARRNERERNRVKMVNNGFALLREHLPVEDLQACEQQSGCETPDGSLSGTQMNNKQSSSSSKAKKYSKVETLRAAIQRIKMLEELIRSTEPGFESMQLNMIGGNANSTNEASLNGQMMAMYDDEEPSLSVCEPLSCGSSSAQSTNLLNNQPEINNNTIHNNSNINHHHLAPTHPMNSASATITTAPTSTTIYSSYVQSGPSSGHFVKLEPHSPSVSQMSPQQVALHQTTTSGLNHLNQQQYHHHHNQSQVHLSQMGVETQAQEVPSHTHIWIQQHQSSFMEQQQQYQQQQQLDSADWYAQQKTNWMIQQQQSAESDHHHHLITLSPSSQVQQQQQQLGGSQQQQVDSPVWFGGRSSSNGSPSSQMAAQSVSQPTLNNFGQINHHQPHQISLYSQ